MILHVIHDNHEYRSIMITRLLAIISRFDAMGSVYIGILAFAFCLISISTAFNIVGGEEIDCNWLAITLATSSISIVCYGLLILSVMDECIEDDGGDDDDGEDNQQYP